MNYSSCNIDCSNTRIDTAATGFYPWYYRVFFITCIAIRRIDFYGKTS